MAENLAGFVLDLRPLLFLNIPTDHLVSFFVTLGRVSSKKKVVSRSNLPRPRQKATVIGKVKLKLPQPADVVKKAFSSRSKSPSAAAATVARYPFRAVLCGAHSCNADDEEVLLIILKDSKSGNPVLKISLEYNLFSLVVLFCIITML